MTTPLQFLSKITQDKTFGDEVYAFDAKAESVAADRGLQVVYPQPNQLQFDIDNEEDYAEWCRRMAKMFRDDFDIDIEEHFSASGAPHRHITLTFFGMEFTEWQRIALQSVLGSDPMREFLNAMRLFHGSTDKPTRLFEKEEMIEKVKKNPPVSRYGWVLNATPQEDEEVEKALQEARATGKLPI